LSSVVEELVVVVMVPLTLVSTDKINVNNIENDKYNVNIVFLDILS
jgi:hypothetical protein